MLRNLKIWGSEDFFDFPGRTHTGKTTMCNITKLFTLSNSFDNVQQKEFVYALKLSIIAAFGLLLCFL